MALTPEKLAAFLPPLLLVFPFLGLAVNIILGSKLGQKSAGIVASRGDRLAFVVSVLLGWLLTQIVGPINVQIAEWITVGSLNLAWVIPCGYPFCHHDAGGNRCGHAYPPVRGQLYEA